MALPLEPCTDERSCGCAVLWGSGGGRGRGEHPAQCVKNGVDTCDGRVTQGRARPDVASVPRTHVTRAQRCTEPARESGLEPRALTTWLPGTMAASMEHLSETSFGLLTGPPRGSH